MFIAEHKGELLNSKLEWRQPSIIRNVIVSGGVEMARGGMGTGFLGYGGQDGGVWVDWGGALEVGGVEDGGGVARASEPGVTSRT